MTAVILRLSASADFQVRSDIATRRHQALVNCAFSFCWAAWSALPPPSPATPPAPGVGGGEGISRPPGSPGRHHVGPGRSGRCAPGWPQGIALQRWWQAWSKAPPPRQLQALMTSLEAGHGLHLYIPG